MNKLTLTFCLIALSFGLTGCSSKSPEQAPVVAQGPSASDKYKQEIAALSQKGITLRSIPGAVGDEPYVLAVENPTVYGAASADLQIRIKNDATVEGSESTGAKAQLLQALQQEVALRSPMYAAPEINRKARELVLQKCSLYGRDALDRPGVLPVIIALAGPEGLRQLRSADGSFYQAAQSALPTQSHVLSQ